MLPRQLVLCRNVYFWRGAHNFWIGSTPEIVILWHNCVHQCWPQLRCHPMNTSQYMCCYLGALPLVLNNMSRGGAPCLQCIYYINTFKDYCFIFLELCTISLCHVELSSALTQQVMHHLHLQELLIYFLWALDNFIKLLWNCVLLWLNKSCTIYTISCVRQVIHSWLNSCAFNMVFVLPIILLKFG